MRIIRNNGRIVAFLHRNSDNDDWAFFMRQVIMSGKVSLSLPEPPTTVYYSVVFDCIRVITGLRLLTSLYAEELC